MRRDEEANGEKQEVSIGGIQAIGQGLNRITKIETWDGLTYQTLYENGVKTVAPVIVGRSWELRVFFTGYNPDGWWNMTVSMVALNLPDAGLRKQAAGKRYAGVSVPEDRQDFNMGAMPSINILIDRVTLWTSDFWTTEKPPENQW